MGCHFLLQCMKGKSESELAQSCLTLSDPMDCSLPGSSIHGIFQARVLEWGAIKRSQTVVNYKQVKRKHDKIHTYPSHCFNSCQRFASPKGSEQRNDSVTPVLEEDASKCDEKRRAGQGWATMRWWQAIHSLIHSFLQQTFPPHAWHCSWC